MQNHVWTGTRERDNFFYTNGAIPVCSSNCHNSLIISNSKNGSIESISDYALIEDEKRAYIIPITETDEIINHASKILKNGKIFYQKPKSISERENLETLSEDKIKQKIFDSYDIEINNLSEIKKDKTEFINFFLKKEVNLFLKLLLHLFCNHFLNIFPRDKFKRRIFNLNFFRCPVPNFI